MTTIARNGICPCGSGKKYKKCCLNGTIKKDFNLVNEIIRQKQQGLGKPIVQTKIGNQQIVKVGNEVYHSEKWKTPYDFLSQYVNIVLTKEWFEIELLKQPEERHLIIKWAEECQKYHNHLETDGKNKIVNIKPNGAINCYLGLSYSLYLMKHNVELQKLLVTRLKNNTNFQGAYYELIVANALIRAGFELTLIDETDRTSGHCEFDAVCKETGERYSVEAKMKSFTNKDSEATSELIPHLNRALKKPASGKRIIFIDLNSDHNNWVNKADRKLLEREKDKKDSDQAYVIITNINFHRDLHSTNISSAILPWGFRIDDFHKPHYNSLSEKYKADQKHKNVYRIAESLQHYPNIPSTFDGSLPCYAFNPELEQIRIGDRLSYKDGDNEKRIGTIISVAALPAQKIITIAVSTGDGHTHLLQTSMLDSEIMDYEKYGNSMFGLAELPRKQIKTAYDFFKFFYKTYQHSTKEKLLEFLYDHPLIEDYKQKSQADLAMIYCELIALEAFNMQEINSRENFTQREKS